MRPDIQMQEGEYKVAINLKDFNPYNPKDEDHEFTIKVYEAFIVNETNETTNSTTNETENSNYTVSKKEKTEEKVE